MPLFSVECVHPETGATSKRIVSAASDGLASQQCQRRGFVVGTIEAVESDGRLRSAGMGWLVGISLLISLASAAACVALAIQMNEDRRWYRSETESHQSALGQLVNRPSIEQEMLNRLDTLTIVACVHYPHRIDVLCRDISDRRFASSIAKFVEDFYHRQQVIDSYPAVGGGVPLELANAILPPGGVKLPPEPVWPKR